jgi:hypothetical protein
MSPQKTRAHIETFKEPATREKLGLEEKNLLFKGWLKDSSVYISIYHKSLAENIMNLTFIFNNIDNSQTVLNKRVRCEENQCILEDLSTLPQYFLNCLKQTGEFDNFEECNLDTLHKALNQINNSASH